MTRELQASTRLAASQLGLLALQRWLPEYELVELVESADVVNHAIRLALFHFHACPTCWPETLVGVGHLCPRGHRLIEMARDSRVRSNT